MTVAFVLVLVALVVAVWLEQRTYRELEAERRNWRVYVEAASRKWLDDEEKLRRVTAQRDGWIRLFNRLEGAVSHHCKGKSVLFVDDVDDALYVARDKVLKAAASDEAL